MVAPENYQRYIHRRENVFYCFSRVLRRTVFPVRMRTDQSQGYGLRIELILAKRGPFDRIIRDPFIWFLHTFGPIRRRNVLDLKGDDRPVRSNALKRMKRKNVLP